MNPQISRASILVEIDEATGIAIVYPGEANEGLAAELAEQILDGLVMDLEDDNSRTPNPIRVLN